MTDDRLVQTLVALSETGNATISGPSVDDVRSLAIRVTDAWPGVSFHITPDPVQGRILCDLLSPLKVRQ